MNIIQNQKEIYDSSATGSPAVEELKSLLQYKHLIVQFIRRDILTRYKRSVLGVAWTMLGPLGTMLVLTIAFSAVLSRGIPSYPAYVLSGLMAWTFFSQTTNTAMRYIVWGSNLMKRIYVPSTAFAVSSIGVGIVNIVLSIIPLFIVMIATGVQIRWTVLLMPIPILYLAMFSLGVGLFVSVLAVYYADVAEVYRILLTAWMYLSPVIYPPSILPDRIRFWIQTLNPMYNLINFFRMPVYDGVVPSWSDFLINGLISLVVLLIGWYFFTLKSDEFAYKV